MPAPLQTILLEGIPVKVLRLDLVHPPYGGNKWYKLKYNAIAFKQNRYEALLTFGGAHSNHIFSTSAFCMENGIPCIGVIRGEATSLNTSPTLKASAANGMQLFFMDREQYRKKEETDFLDSLREQFGNVYVVPEGGNNEEGVRGCSEILHGIEQDFDHIFCACGTGATYAGLSLAAGEHSLVTGISVLKGENTLIEEVNRWLEKMGGTKIIPDTASSLQFSSILNTYHFGGYAAYSETLRDFKRKFEAEHSIPLDHVYTVKLFYAVNDLLQKGKLSPGKQVLIIHSGGQQGNAGFEERYRSKIQA